MAKKGNQLKFNFEISGEALVMLALIAGFVVWYVLKGRQKQLTTISKYKALDMEKP